jgi:hypothetical protein
MLILLIYEIKNLLKLSIRGGCTLGIWFLCRKVSQPVMKFPALYAPPPPFLQNLS